MGLRAIRTQLVLPERCRRRLWQLRVTVTRKGGANRHACLISASSVAERKTLPWTSCSRHAQVSMASSSSTSSQSQWTRAWPREGVSLIYSVANDLIGVARNTAMYRKLHDGLELKGARLEVRMAEFPCFLGEKSYWLQPRLRHSLAAALHEAVRTHCSCR